MTGVPPARADIVGLKSYQAGAQIRDTIRLNANESPVARGDQPLNRYPEVHPNSLRERLAELFDVPSENLLVTRGSSEAIDVLVRAWCRAYADNLVTCPPTFDMYRVYADIQGIRVVDVPLRADDFSIDPQAILAACTQHTKIIFLCTPNNPTGTLIPEDDILQIVRARAGRTLVVVDEAYIEFSDRCSLASRVADYENLVVLRTLSKAHALAGARCGAAIASTPIVEIMTKVLPPYSFPTPVIEAVMRVLSSTRLDESRQAVAAIVHERERVATALALLPGVDRLWPSQSNFILVRFHDLPPVLDFLLQRRILIRDFGGARGLENCARITVGARTENDVLLSALEDYRSESK